MPEVHKRAYRHPKYKTSYRVKNWSEYKKCLRNRGDITIWLSRDAINTWTPPKNGKRGGQPIYSDIAIETSLTLGLVFHLPLRQAEGFLKSILKLMDLYLPCPDHTTVSRRNRTVNVCRYTGSLPDGHLYFIVDSTGLKICGQGEWHSKKHGKRWRKHWSLRTLLVKLIKIGAKVLRQSRYAVFQMAEVAISKEIFAEILSRINRLRCCSLQ